MSDFTNLQFAMWSNEKNEVTSNTASLLLTLPCCGGVVRAPVRAQQDLQTGQMMKEVWLK